MDFPELSAKERDRILAAAARLKSLRANPAAILSEAVRAQEWVLQQSLEGANRLLYSAEEIAQLLRAAVPSLPDTQAPDPLECWKVRYSLRACRLGRYIGTPSGGDERLDDIGDLIASRQKGAGRPQRPLYMNLGDSQDWKLFRRMLGWFRVAQRVVPRGTRDADEITAVLLGDARRELGDLPDIWAPNLARALARVRKRPDRGGLSAREACALWFAEYKKGHPVHENDLEEATREIDRLRRLVNRHRRREDRLTSGT